jgi:hypothetical protein
MMIIFVFLMQYLSLLSWIALQLWNHVLTSALVARLINRTSATCAVARSAISAVFGLNEKNVPNMPPTRQQRHFRQQRAQQAPAQRRQGYHHTPLSQVRNLPLDRQMATVFYNLAAACAVLAFSGPNVPTG